jgi:hypothetical protein
MLKTIVPAAIVCKAKNAAQPICYIYQPIYGLVHELGPSSTGIREASRSRLGSFPCRYPTRDT